MTILDWLTSSTRYTFDEKTFIAIAMGRGIGDVESDFNTLTDKERDLLFADIIFTAVMLSPSSTSSISKSHNNFQYTVGAETDLYQKDKLDYAMYIYKRYDDPKYEVLASTKAKIKLIKITDVI